MNKKSRIADVSGFRIMDMDGVYSPQFRLKSWKANGYRLSGFIGDYAFPGQHLLELTWQEGGDLRVEGDGENRKTGAAVDCLLIEHQTGDLLPCKRENW